MTMVNDATMEKDWRLVYRLTGLGPEAETFRREIGARVARRIDRLVWELQDGYGETGFTPPQGWDWSGIRDSTPRAKRGMAYAIRCALPALLGIERARALVARLEAEEA